MSQKAPTGSSRPDRSTPARPPTRPPRPGRCRSTRPPRMPSIPPSTAASCSRWRNWATSTPGSMNPTQAVVEDGSTRSRGRRRAAGRVRAVGGDAGDPEHRRGRGPHRVLPAAVRRHLQPLPLHPAQARDQGRLRGEPRRPGVLARRGQAEHQGVLRRDRSPTRSWTCSTSGRRRRRACASGCR